MSDHICLHRTVNSEMSTERNGRFKSFFHPSCLVANIENNDTTFFPSLTKLTKDATLANIFVIKTMDNSEVAGVKIEFESTEKRIQIFQIFGIDKSWNESHPYKSKGLSIKHPVTAAPTKYHKKISIWIPTVPRIQNNKMSLKPMHFYKIMQQPKDSLSTISENVLSMLKTQHLCR